MLCDNIPEMSDSPPRQSPTSGWHGYLWDIPFCLDVLNAHTTSTDTDAQPVQSKRSIPVLSPIIEESCKCGGSHRVVPDCTAKPAIIDMCR
jgi:hypothetical protein